MRWQLYAMMVCTLPTVGNFHNFPVMGGLTSDDGTPEQVGYRLGGYRLKRIESTGPVERYQAEPYVVAADVYAARDHVGRAGWTWYTGAAGWMYRIALEDILGLQVHGDTLSLARLSLERVGQDGSLCRAVPRGGRQAPDFR